MIIVYCLPQIDHPGGIERIESIKANSLVRDYGCEVYIIVAQRNDEPYYSLDDRIRVINLDVDFQATVSMPLIQSLVAKKRLKKLYRERLEKKLMEISPDITISTFNQEAAILPKLRDGSKKIIELHFCRHYRNIQAKYFHLSFIVRFLYRVLDWYEERTVFMKYDKFVVLTKEDAADWRGLLPSVSYIPNMLTLQDKGCSSLLNKQAIAVGRLDGQKGFDSLISIWKKVHEERSDWHLKIYGDGQDKEALQHQIDKLGLNDTIKLCGSCKDIQQKYLQSSILLMTSNYEGWGLVLTEGMQCGLPVVAYTCKCGPKDIITDSQDGFCIEHGNQDKFVEKTITLLNNEDLRIKFGKAAKKNVQRYCQEQIMRQWYELFESISN